ncbi:hypothetical protein Tco_0607381, partial [Tanacetum coccineum]
RDDADDEDEDEEEVEEHLAPAHSAVVVPTVELVFPPKGIEPVTPPPSTDILPLELGLLSSLFALGSRYEVEESSTVRPTKSRG